MQFKQCFAGDETNPRVAPCMAQLLPEIISEVCAHRQRRDNRVASLLELLSSSHADFPSSKAAPCLLALPAANPPPFFLPLTEQGASAVSFEQ